MSDLKQCPNCSQELNSDATSCEHCGKDIHPDPAADKVIGTTSIKNILASKYEIIEEIGRGGMAIVFKARQKSLNRIVALKVLLPHFTHDEEFVKGFIDEAYKTATLNHPNLITVYDWGELDGLFFISMEYLHGETVRDRILRSGPMPESEIQSIVVAIARGLDYAHKTGLIHRDVKTSNIFITNDGRAILMDFGIAKSLEGTARIKPDTIPGTVLGTPEYMSPEQARGTPGEQLTHLTDIYSLGVVMYEMATKRLPFHGDNPLVTLGLIQNNPPTPPRGIRKDLNPRLEKLILKCMEKDPRARFQTAGQIFGSPLPEEADPPSILKLVLAGTGSALALLVVVLVIVFSIQGDEEPTRVSAPSPLLSLSNYTGSHNISRQLHTNGVEIANNASIADSLLGYMICTKEAIRNFTYSVTAYPTAMEEREDNGFAYGIFFRRNEDSSSGYQFGLGGLGKHYCVARHDNGNWIDLIDWTERQDIIADGSNKLTVEAKDGRFTFSINNILIDQLTDNTYLSGHIGVFCGPGQRVRFNKVEFSEM